MDGYFKVSLKEFNQVFSSGVSKYAKLVWCYLQFIKSASLPVPRYQEIAHDCNISLPHVKEAISSLRAKGFIEVGNE